VVIDFARQPLRFIVNRLPFRIRRVEHQFEFVHNLESFAKDIPLGYFRTYDSRGRKG
jgi:hypothetical protein